jgi:hypothetical protein
MKYIKLKDLINEILPHGVDTRGGMNIMKKINKDSVVNGLDYFTKEYIITALWTDTDNINAPPEEEPEEEEDDDIEGDEWKPVPEKPTPRPTKTSYNINDFSTETLEKMKSDCNDFYNKYSELYHKAGWADDLAAHDFWLTRNRHGAGFQDREMNELDQELNHGISEEQFEDVKEMLIKASHSFGEFSLYLGDDGLIYGSRG